MLKKGRGKELLTGDIFYYYRKYSLFCSHEEPGTTLYARFTECG